MPISNLMNCLVCGYCFQAIEESEEAVSLEFSSEQVVHYHPSWYSTCFSFLYIAIMTIAENLG